MPSPIVTTLLQNALTAEERSRVLILYAQGLCLLFTVGSPRQSGEHWAAAWDAVYRELLALAFTRHRRLSETVRVTTQNFCTPTYLAQLSCEERLALSQVVAKSEDAAGQGFLRLIRLLDPPWLRAGKPQRRTAGVP